MNRYEDNQQQEILHEIEAGEAWLARHLPSAEPVDLEAVRLRTHIALHEEWLRAQLQTDVARRVSGRLLQRTKAATRAAAAAHASSAPLHVQSLRRWRGWLATAAALAVVCSLYPALRSRPVAPHAQYAAYSPTVAFLQFEQDELTTAVAMLADDVQMLEITDTSVDSLPAEDIFLDEIDSAIEALLMEASLLTEVS